MQFTTELTLKAKHISLPFLIDNLKIWTDTINCLKVFFGNVVNFDHFEMVHDGYKLFNKGETCHTATIQYSIWYWWLVMFYIYIIKRIVCPPIWFVSIVRIIMLLLNCSQAPSLGNQATTIYYILLYISRLNCKLLSRIIPVLSKNQGE